MVITKIIQVFGRVQNVGFRFATLQKAKELKINGFVKNMTDKSVYIEAQGEKDALELFVLWCREGPSWAYVQQVTVSEAFATEYTNFRKR